MEKIRISQDTREIEGIITKGIAKPFGSASHVVLPKIHLGKHVEIVIPKEASYMWVLTDAERREAILVCKKIINKRKSKRYKNLWLEHIERIKLTKFDLDDLIKVVELLKESKMHEHLYNKIIDAYNLKD